MSTPVASLPALIESRRTEIARICARYAVRRLELFGSAATAAFDPARSDVDFLVDFDVDGHPDRFEQYFGMKEALEALLGRPVDLVEDGASTNRYFLESLNRTRRLLYAA
jgi:predicted nucleotidyltransferase